MSLSQIQPFARWSASQEVETQMNNLKCSLTEFLPAGAPAAFSPSWCEQQRRPERGNATSASDSRLPAMAPLKVFRMTLYVCFLLCCLALPLQGLEIFDPEEVEYIRSNATATAGGSVTLDCGSVMPAIYIWGFTKPGTDNNVAVAHNYGQGPKVQLQAGSLGSIKLRDDAPALVVEDLQKDAAGMYTCQALYDTDEGARITFYFTRLEVEDK
ncbi:uncharacterized protein LOC116737227 [Xiphophorus hellerii]|uniref:uncharacterized protein LOC116737227 n=1 Tax=Xiphophorus hellerii TaxID=8084 RepID=UPI0013B37E91|nr:uncharacterized protein LOC116737227 [Xiphophorus hellerii]